MISEAVITTLVNAFRDCIVAGIIPGVTYFLQRKRIRQTTKELGEKLDNIQATTADAMTTCTSTVAALTTQVERLHRKTSTDDALRPVL